MNQTESEKLDVIYIRNEVKERASPEVKYPFRIPIVKSRSYGNGYLCKICDWSGNGSDYYAASGTPYTISEHIHEHREAGEW